MERRASELRSESLTVLIGRHTRKRKAGSEASEGESTSGVLPFLRFTKEHKLNDTLLTTSISPSAASLSTRPSLSPAAPDPLLTWAEARCVRWGNVSTMVYSGQVLASGAADRRAEARWAAVASFVRSRLGKEKEEGSGGVSL